MKTVVILGSRNPAGQTAMATQGLIDGLESQGVEVEKVFLPEMNLESCRLCESDGWGVCATEGRCTINDDLAGIAEHIDASELVVFATPVYFGEMSEPMRVFTDRLRRISHKTSQRTGVRQHFMPAIGIAVAGGGGGGSETCIAGLKKVLQTCGFEALDMIPVRRQNLAIKTRMLELLGQWLPDHIKSGDWEQVIPRPPQIK